MFWLAAGLLSSGCGRSGGTPVPIVFVDDVVVWEAPRVDLGKLVGDAPAKAQFRGVVLQPGATMRITANSCGCLAIARLAGQSMAAVGNAPWALNEGVLLEVELSHPKGFRGSRVEEIEYEVCDARRRFARGWLRILAQVQ
jgi:hypothetical protein